MKNAFIDQFKNIINYRFNLDDDKASEAEVLEGIKKGVEFKGLNVWTLIFAIFIASIGLNVNSTAVIIGAMLISPLMGPIIGIGMGAGVFDFELIKKASKNLLVAALIGLVTSTIYFFISPLDHAQSELLARTSPTIWDVLIAFFGGLAGIVASTRHKFNNVIPGVAIATALMPPLCTAGYGLATAQWTYFFGAFYLFLINTVFISISTFLMVRFLKYQPINYVDPKTSNKVKKMVLTIAILTIIPSLYLAFNFVQNEIFLQNANNLINNEVLANNFSVINKRIDPEKKQILLSVIGNGSIDSLRHTIELKKSYYKLPTAQIVINDGMNSAKSEMELQDLKEGIIEDIFTKQENLIKEKDGEIQYLNSQLAEQKEFNILRDKAIEEFQALYGITNELIIEKAVSHNLEGNDTSLVVIFKSHATDFKSAELKKMESWLSVKFNIDNVKIIKE